MVSRASPSGVGPCVNTVPDSANNPIRHQSGREGDVVARTALQASTSMPVTKGDDRPSSNYKEEK